jgi:hypothetical protein
VHLRFRSALSVVAAGWLSVACVEGRVPQECAAPTSREQAPLGIHQFNDFAKDYEFFTLVIVIDGCVFFHSEDGSLLQRAEFRVPARAVAAGQHMLTFQAQVRSGFSADMHNYTWYMHGERAVVIAPDAPQDLVIQVNEIMRKDPRHRLQIQLRVEPSSS